MQKVAQQKKSAKGADRRTEAEKHEEQIVHHLNEVEAERPATYAAVQS